MMAAMDIDDRPKSKPAAKCYGAELIIKDEDKKVGKNARKRMARKARQN